MNCYTCRDKGMFSYHKPMMGLDEKIYMVLIPQRCYCEAGQRLYNLITMPLDDTMPKIFERYKREPLNNSKEY